MLNPKVTEFVKTVLECSIYVAPLEPGLTHEELTEAGAAAGYERGEIMDALNYGVAEPLYRGNPRLRPASLPEDFNFPLLLPDYRDVNAFQFVHDQLDQIGKSVGQERSQIDRTVLIERALAQSIKRDAIEVAITMMEMTEFIEVSKDGIVKHTPKGIGYFRPIKQVEQREQMGSRFRQAPNADRERAYQIARDIVGRRTDGRPASAEPLDAFAEALSGLGYDRRFRLWWTQLVSELRQLDPRAHPTSACVAAAALVEGSLTFVVKHGRSLGIGLFGSKDYEKDPRSWKIDDLVASASTGNEAAILDAPTKALADGLIKTRQRIHAGRMLSEYPTGAIPDLRPDDARAAKDTAEKVVRRVLDWLSKHPVKPAA